LKALNQSHASTLAQSTLVLSSEVDELRSQVEHLENELLSAQNQAATSKNKRESVIRELKIQNGQLTEQFMQANSALNKFREEAERLREELKRKETIFTSSEKNEKLERSRREELDKEVRDLRDKVGKMQAAEEEYLDLKNNKLPEKETVICQSNEDYRKDEQHCG
jgi:chromosome segregation ATPase